MPIQLDLMGLKRAWLPDARELHFEVQVDWGALRPTLDELDEISSGIGERLHEQVPEAAAQGWVPTKQGWAGILVGVDGIDDFMLWLELFAGTWRHHEGRITGGPGKVKAHWFGDRLELTASLAFTTRDLSLLTRGHRHGAWNVDETTTQQIAEHLVAWTYGPGGELYLSRGIDWRIRASEPSFERALAQGMRRYGLTKTGCVHPEGRRERFGATWAQGLVVCQVVDPSMDWRQRADALRETLVLNPAATDFGMVHFQRAQLPTWGKNLGWPSVTETDVRYSRPLLSSFVPDASGLQVLTDRHLDRANDLSAWTVTGLTQGRHLVAANDLEVWFGREGPSEEVLAQARGDFGDMILTHESIEEHNPWLDGVRIQGRWHPAEPAVQPESLDDPPVII